MIYICVDANCYALFTNFHLKLNSVFRLYLLAIRKLYSELIENEGILVIFYRLIYSSWNYFALENQIYIMLTEVIGPNNVFK